MLSSKFAQLTLGLTGFLYIACGGQNADAQTTLTTQLLANGFNKPVAAVAAPGDSRVFVVEQNLGTIRIVDTGHLLTTPFINVKTKINSSGNEQGLLGMALHPDFLNNGYFYVNYTASGPSRTVVERYQVSASDPNVADPLSATPIISYNQPFSNHNGGDLLFGPDGYLYIPTGDGGSAGDPSCNAQNPASRLGKILRLDVDSATPYAIPASNPTAFTGAATELWAIGMRNPWRSSFDALTGDMYIGDVGQNVWEEIDILAPSNVGYNLGWKMMEGNTCFSTSNCSPSAPACNSSTLTDPVVTYSHSSFGFSCSVTGGGVYRGCKIPELFGTYFFADYCSNQILSFEWVGGAVTNQVNRTAELAPGGGLNINSITAFGTDGDGEILIVDQGGEIYRIVAASQPPLADCDMNGKDDVCEITMNPSLDMNNNGTLDSCEVVCGFTQYGLGASGVNSIVLDGTGSAQLGSIAGFSATNVPSSPALFFVSKAQANTPLLGGVALIDIVLYFQLAVIPTAGGTANWNPAIPAIPSLVGLTVYSQAAALDGSQPAGWALSNGVQLTICP